MSEDKKLTAENAAAENISDEKEAAMDKIANESQSAYINKMHLYGRIWTLLALAAIMTVPVLFCIHLNTWPKASNVFKALASVAPLFYITAIIETTAYTPLLGTGGMYLSFVTGNISNLKLPCALSAMEAAHVKSTSDEGEVITTISIAVSSIVTTAILALFVLAFRPVLPYFTKEDSFFAPAFKQVLPALFGALGAQYFTKHWKISLLPILALVIFLIFSPGTGSGTLIPIGVVLSIVWCLVLYKLKWL